MTTTQTTASLIREACNRAERSVAWLAEKAGMSPTTLRRKLRGMREFTTGEVASIAAALDVRPSTLLPIEFHDLPETDRAQRRRVA